MMRHPGMNPVLAQVIQAGEELAPRQIAGGAHQHDHLGQLRTVY